MITRDNIVTARAIYMKWDILKRDVDLNNVVLEGITFRNYTDEERMENIEMIQVMARLPPFDKILMV